MKPRQYQLDAINGFFRDAGKHPKDDLALVLPTGAGKTIVMAYIIEQVLNWGERCLVLARNRELVVQNQSKFRQCFPERIDQDGVYCAGLGLREHDKDVIFGSIQSLYQKAELIGRRKLVIIDECHQIPDSDDSQYQTLLAGLRKQESTCKLLGLTASPYRLDGGVIFGPGRQFARVAHSVPLGTLIEEGYITQPKTLPVRPIDLDGVRHTAGEFNRSDVESRFLGRSITKEIVKAADDKGCKSVLVFASGVAHAEVIKGELAEMGEVARIVTADTPSLWRETAINQFTSGAIRWLVNCECLTTGFDAPNIGMIVVARATESPGLFLQMVGRGFRLHPGKEVCWIVDYGGNIDRHGPIDSPAYGIDTIQLPSDGTGEAPKKVCPNCFEINPASIRKCIRCGFEFPKKEKEFVASKKSVLEEAKWFDVESTEYSRWKGRNGKTDTLRATYKCKDEDGVMGRRYVSEWICIEHEGYAREKARHWWNSISRSEFPETIDEALEIINVIGVADVRRVRVRQEGRYDRVLERVVGVAPSPSPVDWGADENIPF